MFSPYRICMHALLSLGNRTRYVYAQFVGPDVLGMGAGQFGYLISYSAVTSLLTNVFFVVCAGMALSGFIHVEEPRSVGHGLLQVHNTCAKARICKKGC